MSKLISEYYDAFDSYPLNSDFWDVHRVEDTSESIVPTIHLGRKCLGFTIHPLDKVGVGNDGNVTERIEIGENKSQAVEFTRKLHYSFDVCFGDNFNQGNTRLVFAQFKHLNSKINPILSLRVKSSQPFVCIKYEGGRKDFYLEMDIIDWMHVDIEAVFSLDADSFIKVSFNNQIIADYTGKASFPSEQAISFFKLGIYRDQSIFVDQIFFSNFQRLVS